MSDAWTSLTGLLDEIGALEGAAGVLAWDQQTYQPARGGSARGVQLGILSRLLHERITDTRIPGWLAQIPTDEVARAATVRLVTRAHERASKVPSSLVVELAEAQAAGFDAWVKAKQTSDFQIFAPHLQRLLDLTKKRANAIDPNKHPYDVLLDEFDPGTSVATLTPMFARLRDGLVPLIAAIAARPPIEPLGGRWPKARQLDLHHDVLRAMGYDLAAGRMDDAEHPFTIGIAAPHDVRITTHIYEDDLLSGLGGTIHEGGHALYEQGLPGDLPAAAALAKAASFGLHESQSRFWENAIGRSRPFTKWLAGRIAERFPDSPISSVGSEGRPVDAERLYRASNRVVPGLIRIKADEVTYNLHIIVRFEIELALMDGRVAVADLPRVWNEKMRDYLGVTPPDDAHGVLQDVHWSNAGFGYFPSYTLGNLYSASFLQVMQNDLPDMWQQVERGELGAILGWLRERIHRHGSIDEAPDRVRAVIGDRDPVTDLVNYLWDRHGALYGAKRP